MVYIGYPVSLKEALRLCNITISTNEDDYYNYNREANDKLRKYLQPFGLEFVGLDKGVYVIGYNIDRHLSNMNVLTDDFIVTLLMLKNKVKNAVQKAQIDLSNVEIETDLEEYPIIVQNPEPYFINYGYN
jgi:hypothetical protein